ncbi:MAG: DUF2785 domain-containing protein, partial [Promethearchaeota archaeon]
KLINSIKKNKFKIPESSSVEILTMELLDLLGSQNSELREGSLMILWFWINAGYYKGIRLIEIGNHLCQNLQNSLGEINSDSVFLRSFSVLILATIIEYDEKCYQGIKTELDAFLNSNIIHKWLDICLHYYLREKDYRGFVPIKGWAHSIAHGADLFQEFGKHRFLTKSDLIRVLEMFMKKLNQPTEFPLLYKEDIRINAAIYTILLRTEITIDDFINWLSTSNHEIVDVPWINFAHTSNLNNSYQNIRLFYESLYFMVKIGISQKKGFDSPYFENNLLQDEPEQREMICNTIISILKKMDRGAFYYSEN